MINTSLKPVGYVCFFFFLLFGWRVESSTVSDPEHDPVRVAVIDSGGSFKTKSALLDLLELELSKAEGFELLERARLDSLVEEWELSNSGSSRHSADWVVQAGKIASVDFFIFLHCNDPKDDVFTISWVDTRYGVVINRQELSKPSSGELPGVAAMLTEETVAQLNAVPNDLKDAVLIYFGTQKRIGPAFDEKDFGGQLRKWIEHHINRTPGIYLAERLQAPLLIGERDWNADIPNQLKGAAAVIHFEYERSREDFGKVVVSAMLQRGVSSKSTFTVTGEPTDPFRLAEEILKQCMELMDMQKLPLLTPAREAEVLRALAQASTDPDIALDYNLASYALTPDDIIGLFYFLKNQKRVFPSPYKPSHQLTREEKLARDFMDVYQSYAKEVITSLPEAPSCSHLRGYRSTLITLNPNYENQNARKELSRIILPLLDELVELCKVHLEKPSLQNELGPIYGGYVKNIMMLDPVYGEANIKKITTLLNDGIRNNLFNQEHMYGGPRFAVELASMGLEHKPLYLAFIQHQEPQIQFIGYYGLVHIFTSKESPDFELARRYYLEFVDFIFNSLVPAYPGSYNPTHITDFLYDRSSRRGGNRFYRNSLKDKQFRAEIIENLYSRALEFTPNIFTAQFSTGNHPVLLGFVANAGNPKLAYTLSQQYIEQFEVKIKEAQKLAANELGTIHPKPTGQNIWDYSSFINKSKANIKRLTSFKEKIAANYPEIHQLVNATRKDSVELQKATPLLSIQDISHFLKRHNEKGHVFLHRILSWDGHWILVTNRGLILINPETKNPTSFLAYPEDKTVDQFNHVNFHIDHRGMYINSSNGVLCVYWDGSSELISNKNRLLKNGGPIAVMGDYLLTVFSEPIGPRKSKNLLVLYNLKTSEERIVLSDHSTMRDQPMLSAYRGFNVTVRYKLHVDYTMGCFVFWLHGSKLPAVGYFPDEERFLEVKLDHRFINKGDRLVFQDSSGCRNFVCMYVTILDRHLNNTILEFRSPLKPLTALSLFTSFAEIKGRLLGAKGYELFLIETDFVEYHTIQEILFPWPDITKIQYGGIISDPSGPVILISGNERRAGLYQAEAFMKSLPDERLPHVHIPEPRPGVALRLPDLVNADAWLENQLANATSNKVPSVLQFGNFFERAKYYEKNRASLGKWRSSRAAVTDVMGCFALSVNGRQRLFEVYSRWADQGILDSALCKAFMTVQHPDELDPDGELARKTFTDLFEHHIGKSNYRAIGQLFRSMDYAAHYLSEQQRLKILVPVLRDTIINLEAEKLVSTLPYRRLDEWDYTEENKGSYLLRCASNIIDQDFMIIQSGKNGYFGSGDQPSFTVGAEWIKLDKLPSRSLDVRRFTLDNIKELYKTKYGEIPDHMFEL